MLDMTNLDLNPEAKEALAELDRALKTFLVEALHSVEPELDRESLLRHWQVEIAYKLAFEAALKSIEQSALTFSTTTARES